MARKSRKNYNTTPNTLENKDERFELVEKKRIPTAIYVRLSIENNGQEEDDSIQNQISYVHSYLLDHADEYELVETYVDNGFTGTSFDRPDFVRMMEDVNHGKIGCIIVKDLSRFGRNYIETGIYIENILPKLNVKLIAINDSFDSSREADRQTISVPVKNMINEMYSKDISRKMVTAFKVRRMKKDVLPIGPTPYGYKKNDDGTQFIPDENSDYVKVIFQWYLLGESLEEISDRLNLIGAPVARNLIEGRAGDYKWTQSAVKKIINNPIYTGNICLGRTRRTKVGSQRGVIVVPKDQWTIHKNTHEALVPEADYDHIYEERMKNRMIKNSQMEKAKKKMENVSVDFNNMVYCAECQKKMVTKMEHHDSDGKFSHVKYVCTNRKKTDKACYMVVANDFLRAFVMEQVKNHVRLLSDQADFIKCMKESGGGKDIELSMDKQLFTLAVKLEETKVKEAQVYEDYKTGVIEADDFKLIHEKRVIARQKAEEEFKKLNAKKDRYVRIINNYLDMVDNLDYRPEEDGFDKKLMKELVERIDVYHDNRYEIIFKTHDLEEQITEILERNDS